METFNNRLGQFFFTKKYAFKGSSKFVLHQSMVGVYFNIQEFDQISIWINAQKFQAQEHHILLPEVSGRTIQNMLPVSLNFQFNSVLQLRRICNTISWELIKKHLHEQIREAWNNTPYRATAQAKEQIMIRYFYHVHAVQYYAEICAYMYNIRVLENRLHASKCLCIFAYGTMPLTNRIGTKLYRDIDVFNIHTSNVIKVWFDLARLLSDQLGRFPERQEYCKWVFMTFVLRLYSGRRGPKNYNPDVYQWGLGGKACIDYAKYYFDSDEKSWIKSRSVYHAQRIQAETSVLQEIIDIVFTVFHCSLNNYTSFSFTKRDTVRHGEIVRGGFVGIIKRFVHPEYAALFTTPPPSKRPKTMIHTLGCIRVFAVVFWLCKIDKKESFLATNRFAHVYNCLKMANLVIY